jgi:anti-sigma factor RsiW
MHDCSKTKEDLIDLVFNEVDAEDELRILEELEECRDCSAEYSSMQEALGNVDEAAHAMLPAVDFWTEHHARLEKRIDQFAGASRANVIPFWRRALRTSFSIPVPAAIAAALLLAATSVLAVRSFIFTQELKPAGGQAAVERIQYVEVPVEKRVVEEKIVTRTVYVTKRSRQNNQAAPSIQDIQDMTARTAKDAGASPTRSTLNGFQPPPDVKLTVIKGSFNDEK